MQLPSEQIKEIALKIQEKTGMQNNATVPAMMAWFDQQLSHDEVGQHPCNCHCHIKKIFSQYSDDVAICACSRKCVHCSPDESLEDIDRKVETILAEEKGGMSPMPVRCECECHDFKNELCGKCHKWHNEHKSL